MSRIDHQSASVSDALLLRAWALDLFGGRGLQRHPSDSLATWELFLRSERCALPLRARLAARSPLLERLATVELQRALSARAQLLEIGRLAAAHRLEPIVLKGGVAALSDDPVDLADVDVLVRQEQSELLANLLNQRGYGSAIAGSAAHLPARFGPESVPIEVHFAINDLEEIGELRARAQPMPGCPGLWRLSPPDHLWHLLVHSVVSHPERRGCLRDVLLITSAAQQCSPVELADVTGRIARSSRTSALSGMLALARAAGGGVDGTDCFRQEAAANYLLRDRFPWLARWRVLPPMATTVFVLLGSRWDRQAEWAAVLRRRVPSEPSTWKVLAALQRRAPRLGDMTRRLLRVGRLVVARLFAWPIAARAKRLADAH